MATTSRSPRRPGCTPSARCTGCPYFRDAKVYFKGEGADERRVQAIGNDRYEARYVGPQGEERLVWSSASERRRQDRVAERQNRRSAQCPQRCQIKHQRQSEEFRNWLRGRPSRTTLAFIEASGLLPLVNIYSTHRSPTQFHSTALLRLSLLRARAHYIGTQDTSHMPWIYKTKTNSSPL